MKEVIKLGLEKYSLRTKDHNISASADVCLLIQPLQSLILHPDGKLSLSATNLLPIAAAGDKSYRNQPLARSSK